MVHLETVRVWVKTQRDGCCCLSRRNQLLDRKWLIEKPGPRGA